MRNSSEDKSLRLSQPCYDLYFVFARKVNKTEIKETAPAALFGQINALEEQNRIYSHSLTIYGNIGTTIIKVIFLKSAENSKITHMSAESEK